MKMKSVKIFGILISALVLFASCGQLMNSGETRVSINLPHVSRANSRAISSNDLQRIKGDHAGYRVHMNDVVLEGTGGNFSATFAVGSTVNVFIECVNGKGEVILRTVTKSLVVAGGENSLNFNLKEDGTEIIPESQKGRVIYSYGEAESKPGDKGGLPADNTIYRPGDTFTVQNGDSMTWTHATAFTGWKTNVALTGDTNASTGNVDAGGDVQLGGTYIMPAGGVVLMAQWQKNTYAIKYDANADKSGGTATSTSMPNTENITAFENATVPDVELDSVHDDINGKNYTFTGYWLTDPEGTDGKRYRAGDTIPMTADITLYAQWSDETMYTVTFTNPSSGSPSSFTQQMPTRQSVKENESATWTNPSSLGYKFEGWRVTDAGNAGGVSDLSASTTTYTPQGNTTLEGKWSTITYTVTYAVKSGEGTAPSPAPTTTVSWNSAGGNFTPNNGANFSRPGYTLTGWEFSDGTSAGTKGVATGGRTVMEKADSNNAVTLYAKWEATTYTIQFNGVSASGSQNSIDFTVEDTSTTLPQTTTFTKPGEIFSHWATSSGGVSVQLSNIIAKIKDGDTGDFTMNDNTITIYAVWKAELLDTPSVGSIIMNDGSLRTKDTLGSDAANAVAVVYKVSGGKAWAIGKVLGENLAWCVGPSASLPNGVEGYNTRFAELETNVTGSGQDLTTYSFSGYEDGSTGLDILKGGVTDYGNGNYPAWEFCENYGTTNCSGTNFTSGWYLPSLVEVRDIALVVSDDYSSPSDVADALTSVDSGTYTSTPPFWYLKVTGLLSSSTVSPGDSSGINGNAYFLLLQPGANVGNATSDKLGAIVKDDTSKCVWAVRQFTY